MQKDCFLHVNLNEMTTNYSKDPLEDGNVRMTSCAPLIMIKILTS